MQNICLLFAGRRGLDDLKTRTSVLRIPEVSRKLKEAQWNLEQVLGTAVRVDLYSYIQSSNEEFNSKPSLKSLVAAIVQVGLFDRFVKYRSRPQFLVGRVNGCSAMRVCAGLQTLKAMIETSDFAKENSLLGRYNQSNGPQLAGVKLEEHGALLWNPEGFYQELQLEHKDASKIIEELSLNNLLNQCIHIGPTFEFRLEEFQKAGIYGVASMSSIDADPILSSFWKAAI